MRLQLPYKRTFYHIVHKQSAVLDAVFYVYGQDSHAACSRAITARQIPSIRREVIMRAYVTLVQRTDVIALRPDQYRVVGVLVNGWFNGADAKKFSTKCIEWTTMHWGVVAPCQPLPTSMVVQISNFNVISWESVNIRKLKRRRLETLN